VPCRGKLAAALALVACCASPAHAQAPDDPLFAYQWHLRAIQIPAAWEVSRGAGVTVAVLDTGVAYENRRSYRRAPELAATRLVSGYDFVDGDAHPNDVPPRGGRRSHGTQMASIIAATAGNALGGAGVAPEAAIMPVRVLEPDLSGSARSIARGLRFAADHGADVASLSIAGRSPSRQLKSAVTYATSRGVVVVAATGNDGLDSVSWPAAYPEVIAVGAVARDRTRAPYSNYGAGLDIVAPGGAGVGGDTGYGPPDGVVSQTLKGGPGKFCFCFTASTSAAAAQVSGVAALLVGARPARSSAEIRAALLSSARDLGARGPDREYGAGLVQAAGALADGRPPAAAPAPARPRRPAESSSDGWWPAVAAGAGGLVLLGAGVALRRRRRRAT